MLKKFALTCGYHGYLCVSPICFSYSAANFMNGIQCSRQTMGNRSPQVFPVRETDLRSRYTIKLFISFRLKEGGLYSLWRCNQCVDILHVRLTSIVGMATCHQHDLCICDQNILQGSACITSWLQHNLEHILVAMTQLC